jgi:hypothetical protein
VVVQRRLSGVGWRVSAGARAGAVGSDHGDRIDDQPADGLELAASPTRAFGNPAAVAAGRYPSWVLVCRPVNARGDAGGVPAVDIAPLLLVVVSVMWWAGPGPWGQTGHPVPPW